MPLVAAMALLSAGPLILVKIQSRQHWSFPPTQTTTCGTTTWGAHQVNRNLQSREQNDNVVYLAAGVFPYLFGEGSQSEAGRA
jgi:hypothetical protein